MDIKSFIANMPKAELHLHIEGTLEPEMMMSLAERNGVELPYNSVEEIRAAYEFTSLQDFLDLYYQGMSVLQTAFDFYDLTNAYLTRCFAQNVTHVEIFFDPQGHTSRGLSFETVLDGVTAALDEAERNLGITSKLIMCFLRHLSEEDAFETLEAALPHQDRIIGVGLDSSEKDHPPPKFMRVFKAAREAGFIAVAHAGEEGSAANVADAVDLLEISRIDHGNAILDDLTLTDRISAAQIPLTMCPLSNLRLCVIDDMKQHPIRRALEAGLLATINSDDPAYFGGYMSENYLAVQEALNLTHDEIRQLGRNAYLGSFMEDSQKAAALANFDAFASANSP
ncbi:MAG: adenosine deaminase [Rhodospirillaceae bacterium]|nr:adenosine deaminase [Rhodospirillaceae bacterium]|tara:strand:+ start:899 stop:1915 length:1017 start_codon:yes stop_codon:yes gene_type:complete